MSDLTVGLRRLGLLRRREAILQRRAKAAAQDRAIHENQMFELMVSEGFKPGDSAVKLDGIHYTPNSTTFAQVTDKAKLVEWLEENDSGLIDPKIKKGELNDLVREKLDNGEVLPPGLNYFDKVRVTTKGATKQEVPDDEEG